MNKSFAWLISLLILANIVMIAIFFGKKETKEMPRGGPKDFLIKELKLDAKQQEQLEGLVKEHRSAAEELRKQMRTAKDNLFDLVSKPESSDSIKRSAAEAVSKITEELDLITLNHFQKVRALCNPEQQKKFDEIIHEVTAMMAGPHRPPPPPRP
jgi:periplasmic protein CpxP/Spy